MSISFITQSHEVLDMTEDPVGVIARAARTCYRSEANASPENDVRLVRNLIKRGHEAMVEHAHMTVRFKTDRSVSHELVRHRLFSFAQESQRYVNSDKCGFEFILPVGVDGYEDTMMRMICRNAAQAYSSLIEAGAKPEIARAILPNATATEIVVTGNMREWRHCLRLRCDSHAHPQIRALMTPLLTQLKDDERTSVLFEDIEVE